MELLALPDDRAEEESEEEESGRSRRGATSSRESPVAEKYVENALLLTELRGFGDALLEAF